MKLGAGRLAGPGFWVSPHSTERYRAQRPALSRERQSAEPPMSILTPPGCAGCGRAIDSTSGDQDGPGPDGGFCPRCAVFVCIVCAGWDRRASRFPCPVCGAAIVGPDLHQFLVVAGVGLIVIGILLLAASIRSGSGLTGILPGVAVSAASMAMISISIRNLKRRVRSHYRNREQYESILRLSQRSRGHR